MAPLAVTDPALSAALRHVPGLEAGATPRLWQRLPGGSVNDVWRVETTQGRFVLRVDGAAWRRPGVDRGREQRLARLAEAAGLAPRICVWRPEQGVLVSEFIDGELWSTADGASAAALGRLGAQLARLHALPVPQVARFAPLTLAEDYAAAARVYAGHAAGLLSQALRALAQAWERLQDDARAAVIVHGDLNPANLLWQPVAGERLWLLDWEYAQRADPLLDVASVLVWQPSAWPLRGMLLAAAQLGSVKPASLAAALRVHRLLGWLWYQARGEIQPLPEEG